MLNFDSIGIRGLDSRTEHIRFWRYLLEFKYNIVQANHVSFIDSLTNFP